MDSIIDYDVLKKLMDGGWSWRESGSGSGSGSGPTVTFHVCSAAEVTNGVPNIANPKINTFYLVSSGESAPNLFIEWVYINGAWEKFGSATIDLTNYVKDTDFATTTKAGVIKYNAAMGTAVNSEGQLGIKKAEAADIDAKTSNYRPIVPSTLDYAVKVALSTNSEVLTDEEKAAIIAWVGAVAPTDYATNPIAGVIKIGQTYATGMSGSGLLTSMVKSLETYNSGVDTMFISKGTLNNIKTTYVKEGVVSNDIELEREEKVSAHKWLGITGNEYREVDGGPIITFAYLEANVHHNFTYADPTEININSLQAGPEGMNNTYDFEFNTGTSYIPTLNLPEGVVSDLVLEKGRHYMCSIVNNRLLWADWAV